MTKKTTPTTTHETEEEGLWAWWSGLRSRSEFMCVRARINDGPLIDVSEVALSSGIWWPVALTRAAWDDCVAWSGADPQATYEEEARRLRELLSMLSLAMRQDESAFQFHVRCVPLGGGRPRLMILNAVWGAWDEGETSITVGLSGEG